MARRDGDELSVPSTNDLGKLSHTRHEMIEPLFESYLQGRCHYTESVRLPTLELLSPSDVHVSIVRDAESRKVVSVNVGHDRDPAAINFMGYTSGQDCVVFKGEARLFSDFIDFTSILMKWESVEGVFGAASEVRVPEDGLQRGLSYDEFASRVEIVEYAMFAGSSSEALVEEPENIELPLLRSSTPQSRPPTPGVDYTFSDILKCPFNRYIPKELPAERYTEGFRTPSTGSTSSLSPPPEEIKTPPSMELSNLHTTAGLSETELGNSPTDTSKPKAKPYRKGVARVVNKQKKKQKRKGGIESLISDHI